MFFGDQGPAPKGNAPRRPAVEGRFDEAHLRLIRACPCLACGGRPAEAAHLRYGDHLRGKPHAGTGQRPDDKWTNPLCPKCHRLGPGCQHDGNERVWWEAHRIDPVETAQALWTASSQSRARGTPAHEIIETMSAIVRAARRRRR